MAETRADVREIVARGAHYAYGYEFSGDFGEPVLGWDDVDDHDRMRSVADDILAALEAAGLVIVDAARFERLRAYVVADQEFSQASTWAGIWSDDDVQRAAIHLQYAGREKRRRDAHHAITLGDLEPPTTRKETTE